MISDLERRWILAVDPEHYPATLDLPEDTIRVLFKDALTLGPQASKVLELANIMQTKAEALKSRAFYRHWYKNDSYCESGITIESTSFLTSHPDFPYYMYAEYCELVKDIQAPLHARMAAKSVLLVVGAKGLLPERLYASDAAIFHSETAASLEALSLDPTLYLPESSYYRPSRPVKRATQQ